MWVHARDMRPKTNQVQQMRDTVGHTLSRPAIVMDDGILKLITNPHHRIKGIHRPLRHISKMPPAHDSQRFTCGTQELNWCKSARKERN
jgi:hypothetical protein